MNTSGKIVPDSYRSHSGKINPVLNGIFLRPAMKEDARFIRRLIISERLNPLGINWRRFVVAVDVEGRQVGCVQLKPHQDGSLELASLAVIPSWRNRRVGLQLIKAALKKHPGRLYLTCRADLEEFYTRFGFKPVPESAQLPPYFQRIRNLSHLLRNLRLTHGTILIMRRN